MLADIAIIVSLIVLLLIGMFRGALRQLLVLGACLVALVVAAQGRAFLGDWMRAQEPDFSEQYANMLGFALGFILILLAALALIELSGRSVTIGRPIVEELVGGGALVLAGLFALSTLLLALGTYYTSSPRGPTAEIDLVRQLVTALDGSTIARVLRDTVVPQIQSILGPLLPPDVRHFS